MPYFDELVKAMSLLSEQDNSIFLGQSVKFPGTAMFNTLKHLPEDKRIEMPVAENMQMGMSIGLSLQGYLPISIYPRWNFLLSATDQLVNHLDKIYGMSQGEYKPKVIIRTSVGSESPLHPGSQHIGNYSFMFDGTHPCGESSQIRVVELDHKRDIVPAYQEALEFDHSTILVEHADMYNE
jgi:pyruvate/2-oxoglutarate/acetoin dehydrogenase E1 component